MKRKAKTPDGFPLWVHPSGRWCKKVKGRAWYFGKVADDPKGEKALERWLADKDDLLAGREPRRAAAGLTVADLCNRYMTAKRARVDSGELRLVSWKNYLDACKRLAEFFGRNRPVASLTPSDFEALRAHLTATLSLVTVAGVLPRIRLPFTWGVKQGLIDPPRYGDGLAAPSKRALLAIRQARGPRLFTPAEIHKLLSIAKPPMRAMILLGINAAYGPSDLGRLPLTALDLQGGWGNYPRPKTGVVRRAWLWPETVEALRVVIAQRPVPAKPEYAGLAFLTRNGKPFLAAGDDAMISPIFRALLRKAGIEGKGHYDLRRTWRTVGDEVLDVAACDVVMGHTDGSMGSIYRQAVSDDRIRRVCEHVRSWLYAEQEAR